MDVALRPGLRRVLLGGLVGALLATAGCRGPADDAQDESLVHLEAALAILQEHAGDTDAATAALDAYLADHRDPMLEAKARGITALERMSPSDRERFRTRAIERTRTVRERLETLARAFPDPQPIFQRLRQFQ